MAEKKSKAIEEAQEAKEKQAKKLTQAEFEKRVLELAGKGLTSEKIGQSLKNANIHSSDFEKKISRILKENNVYVSADLKNVEGKLKKIEAHFEKNKQDKRAMREKSRIYSQLRKLRIYSQK